MGVHALLPLVVGAAATLLALVRLGSWTAVGLTILPRGVTRGRATVIGLSILVGSSLTAVIYAAFAAGGHLAIAIAVDAIVAAWAVGLRWRSLSALHDAAVRHVCATPRWMRCGAAAIAMLLWLIAIGPPRDADVMHYHLAHLRQIIEEGQWRQLPICSYGIPFGWTLGYLPFEWIGIPQTAHLLNAGAWLLACGACVDGLQAANMHSDGAAAVSARWMLLGATLLPAVLKAATTAMADAFTILVVALTVALLLEWPRAQKSGAAALGFVAFVGLSTRYQAAAVALAVSLLIMVEAFRRAERRPLLWPFVLGAAVALLCASPFYIANAITLGSPVWPFGSTLAHFPGSGAASRVAARCASVALSGGWPAALRSARHLMVDITVFPVPVVTVVSAVAAAVLGLPAVRRVARFTLLYLAIWAFVQHRLEPRFSIFLIPAAVVCSAPLLASLLRTRIAPLVRVAGATAIGVVLIGALLYAREYAEFAVTANLARFHHATWYWPAYDWANRETPPDARFAVALYGGQTYQLHRWNVSVDPNSSAVLDWDSIDDGCELASWLATHRIGYLFFGPNVATGRPISERMDRLVTEAVAEKRLVELREFDVPIVYGRVARLERSATIRLYEVAPFDSRCAAAA